MKKIAIIIVLFSIGISAKSNHEHILFHNPFKGKSAMNPYDPDPEAPKEKAAWKDKIGFGGGVSINFWNGIFVSLNPQIIYKLSETTWFGGGPFYQYIRQTGGSTFSSYGLTAFGRKYVTPDLFGQLEFNQLYFKNGAGSRIGQGFGMIGGGYQPSPRAYIMLMYIFTKDPNNYAAFGGIPWVIRGGINI